MSTLKPIGVLIWYKEKSSKSNIMGVFGRVNLREDGKKMRENEERKLFEGYSTKRGRGKKCGGARVFYP